MRCPDCNKFVSMENADPEINLSVEHTEGCEVRITGDARLVRTCAECGTELKDRTADIDEEIGFGDWSDEKTGELLTDDQLVRLAAALKDGADIEVEDDGGEVEESGGSRYAKNILTFRTNATVTVEVKGEGAFTAVCERTIEDQASASEYDECC